MSPTKKDAPAVRVQFPCVHGLASGYLVTINCFAAKEMKSTIKVVTGVDEEIARRVIGASRYSEQDERAAVGVLALFSNPLFSGESYGLALAVADKLARYQGGETWTEIYATGKIPADGGGRVDGVGSFAKKTQILLEHACPGSLFLFPQANSLSPELNRQHLEMLEERGARCLSLSHVSELDSILWQRVKESKGEKKQTGSWAARADLIRAFFSVRRVVYLGLIVFFGIFALLALRNPYDALEEKNVKSQPPFQGDSLPEGNEKTATSHQEAKQHINAVPLVGPDHSEEPAYDSASDVTIAKPSESRKEVERPLQSVPVEMDIY